MDERGCCPAKPASPPAKPPPKPPAKPPIPPPAKPAEPAKRPDEATRKAHAHVKQGQAYFDRKLYTDALAEFQAAYALRNEPETLFALAETYRLSALQGSEEKALELYKQLLEQVADGPLADKARDRIAELHERFAARAATPPPPPPVAPKPQAPPPPPALTCPRDMSLVASGTFWMGSAAGVGGRDEHPQHKVTLSSYCLDRTEVTAAAYAQCMTDGRCGAPGTDQGCTVHGNQQDHPVNCVSWDQAEAFCTHAGKRLPTEAEWEHAARGNEAAQYPWGDDEPTSAKLNWRTEHGGTMPVGSFPDGATATGIYDLAGNVWEWVADWYGPYGEDTVDPKGPATGRNRIARGGGWDLDGAVGVRSAFRRSIGASFHDQRLGFRCARGR